MKTVPPLINADERRFQHSEITDGIIRVFYQVYNELGYGFLESVYEEAMFRALQTAGFNVQRQFPIAVWFRGERIGEFRADLIGDEKIIVELKAARAIEPIFESQTA